MSTYGADESPFFKSIAEAQARHPVGPVGPLPSDVPIHPGFFGPATHVLPQMPSNVPVHEGFFPGLSAASQNTDFVNKCLRDAINKYELALRVDRYAAHLHRKEALRQLTRALEVAEVLAEPDKFY